MATVRDILAVKGGQVLTVSPHATVLDAAQRMNEHKIGSLVVLEHGRVAGIFTERDILRRVVAAGLAPDTTKVADVFTRDVVTTSPNTSVDECGALMSSRRVRHLPVVDATGLHGVVTIGDLLAHQVSEHETTIQHLNSYVFDMR